MVTKAYQDYIKSEKWKRKRQEVFAIHGKRCKACGNSNSIMHCHHLTYERLGRESALNDFYVLCVPCHKEVTAMYRRNRARGLRRVTMEFIIIKRRQRK